MSNEISETGRTSLADIGKFIIAVLCLIGFAWLVVFLLGMLNAQEPAWTRAVYLLSGVEAVAFAAAGFLFGREVNRERAEKAEKRADVAADKAAAESKKASEAETKGNSLAALIRSKSDSLARKTADLEELRGVPDRKATPAGLEELVDMADRLFPPQS
jgi:hypothetical protein